MADALSSRPKASRHLIFHGQDTFRVTGFVVEKPLRCPAGHAVSEPSRILEDGAIYCDYRPAKGHAQCGALIYLLVLPGRGDRRRLWAAHCTKEELTEIERLGLDADGVLAYFGATFTG
jgi:hypothetical protein